MSFLSDLMTGGVGSIVKEVGEVAGQFITTDKERMAAEAEMERIGVEREQAYLADVQDARHLQVAALQQDDLFSKRFIYWFSIGWSVFAMAFMLTTTLCDIPKENQRTVDTIIGFLLGTAIASIFNFFLSSTLASRHKDSTISDLARAK